MQNARLDDSQAGIKIAGRNINNLRHTDDTSVITESKEELKSLSMKVKEENEKAGKTQHSKNKDHGIWSCNFMAQRRVNVEIVKGFLFLGSKITVDDDYSHKIKRLLLLRRKAMTNLDSILKNKDITCKGL